jgi:light-regulated signal transduction histidine kinase (bacteriophytochrome)
MPSESTHVQENQAGSTAAGASDVTRDNCADEQIRLPGSIQPHGFMLGLDEPGERIVLASENAEAFLGTPLKLILGSPIDLLVERELLSAIRNQRCAVEPEGMVTYLGVYTLRGDLFAVVTHCIESKRILEFERQDRLVGAEMMNSIITNFVGTLSKLETPDELCDAVTRQVAQLTGFDRVLLYNFDEDGHGTVLSEANSGRLPSYLDLRFPATDIPQQARDLYVLNTVRIIPDAHYVPSALRSIQAEAPHILDLSLSILRSVSPVHVQYMQNMGTQSSMSISIVSEGRLWGLISGHHAEPRMVPYLVRSACDMLSKLVGTQLTAFRTTKRLKTLMQYHNTQRQLLTHVAGVSNYLSALATQLEPLLQITAADGVALWVDGKCEVYGGVPDITEISRIVSWLDAKTAMQIYTTQRLGSDIALSPGSEDLASGLVAIRISDIHSRYVLWFRPQVIRTVKWAGEPVKDSGPNLQLHPRKSFETWQETLRGQSLRWTDEEQESAREFRAAIVSISLRRAEEEAELSNARFEQLTHALPAKVFTADDDGTLIYTNDRWQEQGMDHTGIWYGGGRLLPEDEKRIVASWRQAVETGKDFEEEVRFLVGPERIPRWNLVRAVPFQRQGEARAGWVGSVIDLTDRHEREAALRMTEKLALTGRMTSVIAHEINNPLESITNLLYLVRQDLPEGADATQYINQAESELERISGITKQTLRWGRENSGRVERFRAGAIFADVLRLFRGKLQNRNVTATVVGGEDVMMEGILGQIRQVVANLVSNAVDASLVGGKMRIEARASADGGAEILVTDQGAGMTPEVQAQLFQPFYSTKGDLGNGLGLYISHEIMERHGGELRVETELGRGTTMHLLLPPTSNADLKEREARAIPAA